MLAGFLVALSSRFISDALGRPVHEEEEVAYEADNGSGISLCPGHVLGHRDQLHRSLPAGLSPRSSSVASGRHEDVESHAL